VPTAARSHQSLWLIFVVVLLTTAYLPGQQTAAQMISPAPGSTLTGPVVTFTWGPAAGTNNYELDVGTQRGLSDIAREQTAATEQRVIRIPTDGSTVYVRLQALVQGAWVSNDYIYTAPPSPVPIERLTACKCIDLPRLQDRVAKLKMARTIVTNKFAGTVSAPATQQFWASIRSEIDGVLAAMAMANTTAFADTSLFSGNGDPFCGMQMISGGACLDQSYDVHQRGHAASCAAGNWRWQTPWTENALLLEEAAALQAEISSIDKTITELGCGLPSATVCPQFILMVQNVTNTAVNMAGLVEQSSRSLNGQQGILVPLLFYEDGTFEGFGSGVDAGSAVGATSGEVVRSRFGHLQAVEAFGQVRQGSCASQPCVPDAMHLVLVGGPSQQITEMHARGWVNRDMNRATPTGAARLEFDLPAYVGSAAQQTFFATGMLNSYLQVHILQADNGAPALPQGSSLLQAQQQCKARGNQSAK
jgi:hypothetical protein